MAEHTFAFRRVMRNRFETFDQNDKLTSFSVPQLAKWIKKALKEDVIITGPDGDPLTVEVLKIKVEGDER